MKYPERTEKRIQLKSMPGWKVHWACSRFVSSFEIFRRNSIELLTFLGNPPSFSFQFLPDEEARIQKIESDTESLRRIHNYVASAKTLIDHCRRIKSKYLQSDSQSKYDELIKDDFTHPRAQLIINLRNFMLHVDLPSICNRVKWMECSSRIALLPDGLLQWEKWSSGVKGYLLSLTNQEEYLFLEELVAEYNEKPIDSVHGYWMKLYHAIIMTSRMFIRLMTIF